MIEVKICGITRIEDAIAAAEYGADALGFVFYRRSPRYIPPEAARRLIGMLPNPRTLLYVGVFVNEDSCIVAETMEYCGLTMAQLHGEEPPEYARIFPRSQIIKAFAPSSAADLDAAVYYPCHAVLIDARVPGRYGGTGKRADWELAAQISKVRPTIIAGGLSLENIEEAIREISPCAVDASSGIETAPGMKDVEKMTAFIEAAHTAGRSVGAQRPSIFTINGSES